MRVLLFALMRPDMDFWHFKGTAFSEMGLENVRAMLRNDPQVSEWHECEDLDHDIDKMVLMTAEEVSSQIVDIQEGG